MELYETFPRTDEGVRVVCIAMKLRAFVIWASYLRVQTAYGCRKFYLSNFITKNDNHVQDTTKIWPINRGNRPGFFLYLHKDQTRAASKDHNNLAASRLLVMNTVCGV